MLYCRRVTGALAVAGPASAQGPAPLETGYAHVNIGGQSGSHDLTQEGSFPLYDETGLFTSKASVGGSPIFDIGGGYRVWDRWYGGVSFTHASDTSTQIARSG